MSLLGNALEGADANIGPYGDLVSLEGLYVHELASFLTGREHNDTVDECEQGVVFAHTYVQTRVVLCTTLTFNDVTGFALRPTGDFYAKAFAF